MVTYAQLSGVPDLTVSSSGKISCPDSLVTGIYTANGSAKDSFGDSATWSFSLTVVGTTITQAVPVSATSATAKAFVGQIEVSGSHGRVTYTQSRGAPDVTVSSSGKVSAPATLPAGAYNATGKEEDALGDTGTWSFALSVVAGKLTQGAPRTATVATGKTFTAKLEVSGAHGSVTYAQASGASALRVSVQGQVSAGPDLVAGTYRATGTSKDVLGDDGKWSFAVTVVATKLTQTGPVSEAVPTARAFTAQLKVTGVHGRTTFAQSSGAPDLKISSQGALFAAADLKQGSYKATGSVKDSLGDTGTWSFALKVVAIKLTQAAPDTATNAVGKAFTAQLKVSGSHGLVTYAQSTGAPHLEVSSSGMISALAGLAIGTYKATGTVRDSLGDTGTWSFVLTVKAAKLVQIAPMTGIATAGKVFVAQLKVSGSHGVVTWVETTGAQIMTVSSSGRISAPATLAAATYKITGTMKNAIGDRGTWTFTLIVKRGAPLKHK